MVDRDTWDWDTAKKLVSDLRAVEGRFDQVHEWVVSDDGERIAAPVLTGPEVFRVWVNDSLWEGEFEKAWNLVFAPDGRLTALVRIDDEWTVAIDSVPWEGRWEFAWNPTFNRDGSVLAVQIKDNMEYTVAVNGRPWEQRFHSSRGLVVSDDGSHVAALVQVEPLAEADIVGFMEGTWSVAVDGTPWEKKFINVYGPAITPDGAHVAAEVRLDICDYTLAEDAVLWDRSFGCVWEPAYRNGNRALIAPVRTDGSWTIAENGSPIWDGRFMQLWNQRVSADGEHVAAVAFLVQRSGPAAGLLGGWTTSRRGDASRRRVGDRSRRRDLGREFRHGVGPRLHPLRRSCGRQGGAGWTLRRRGRRQGVEPVVRDAVGACLQPRWYANADPRGGGRHLLPAGGSFRLHLPGSTRCSHRVS